MLVSSGLEKGEGIAENNPYALKGIFGPHLDVSY
jgi:hypothetical protein